MGYLDSAGLSHFWEKIKAALAGKLDLETADGRYMGRLGGTVDGCIDEDPTKPESIALQAESTDMEVTWNRSRLEVHPDNGIVQEHRHGIFLDYDGETDGDGYACINMGWQELTPGGYPEERLKVLVTDNNSCSTVEITPCEIIAEAGGAEGIANEGSFLSLGSESIYGEVGNVDAFGALEVGLENFSYNATISGNTSLSMRLYTHGLEIHTPYEDGLISIDGKVMASDEYVAEYVDKKIADRVLDVYSITETRIGTWIDGKPLYRTVVQGRTGTTNSQGINFVTDFVSAHNIEWVARIYGSVHPSSGWMNVPCSASDWKMNFYVWQGHLAYKNETSLFNNAPFCAVVEYTKTTD